MTLLNSPWVEKIFRWIIGGMFIFASIHKIAVPAEFAKIIYGYGLAPLYSINLIAIILPFLELVTGLLLVSGIKSKSSATVAITMLAVFTLAVSINIVRGYEFDCGCFSFNAHTSLGNNIVVLLRDIVLMGICLYILIYRGGEKQGRKKR